MRIFLLTDLEGIAGVDNIEQMDQAKDTYRNTCEMLEHSINLAVAACYDSGAEQVYYMDGHGGRKTINVNPEILTAARSPAAALNGRHSCGKGS